MSDNQMGKIKISESMALAVLPFIAYVAAFSFEAGYLQAFNIPIFLVKITLEKLIIVLSTLIVVSLLIIGFIDLFLENISDGMRQYKFLAFPIITWTLLAVFTWNKYQSWETSKLQILIVFLLGLFWLLIYGFPYVLSRISGKSYIDEYIASIKSDATLQKKNLTTRLLNFFGVDLYLLGILCLVVIPVIASNIGSITAKGESSFLVTKIDDSEYALIRKDDTLCIYIKINAVWVSLYDSKRIFTDTYLLANEMQQNQNFQKQRVYHKTL